MFAEGQITHGQRRHAECFVPGEHGRSRRLGNQSQGAQWKLDREGVGLGVLDLDELLDRG